MKRSHRKISNLDQSLKEEGVSSTERRRICAGLTALAASDLIWIETVLETRKQRHDSTTELLRRLVFLCQELKGII